MIVRGVQRLGWSLMGLAWPSWEKFRSMRLYRVGARMANWRRS